MELLWNCRRGNMDSIITSVQDPEKVHSRIARCLDNTPSQDPEIVQAISAELAAANRHFRSHSRRPMGWLHRSATCTSVNS